MYQVASFEEEIGSIANLEMKASRVLIIWIPVAGHDCTFDVEVPVRREANFGPRGACGIEGFIYGTEEVTERVAHWLDEPRTSVFLIAVKIQTSQLSRSYPQFVVQENVMAEITIRDLAGRLIYEKDVSASKGNNETFVNLSYNLSGAYLLQLKIQGKEYSRLVVLQ